MTRKCIFCGKKPVTKEHIFGAWLSPLFPAPPGKQMFVDMGEFTKGQINNANRRFPQNLDLKVKQVCSSCNNGWMSRLERKALEIIPALYTGEKSSISPDDQSLLASWATKTAVTVRYLEKQPLVPLRRREWLFQNHTPPSDTSVWIARYDGDGIATIISKDLFIKGNQISLNRPNGQLVLFSIGSLFFIVLSMYLRDAKIRVEFPNLAKEHLYQIWPSNGQNISWPQSGIDDATRTGLYIINDWDFLLKFRLPP